MQKQKNKFTKNFLNILYGMIAEDTEARENKIFLLKELWLQIQLREKDYA